MQLATECQPPVVETARLRYFERMARLYEARPPAPLAPRSPPNSAGRPVSLPANRDKASIKGQSRTHSPNVHLVLDLHVRFSLPPYSSSRSYSFCASRWLTCSSGAWRSGLCSTPLALRDFLYPTRPGTVSLTAHASPPRVWHALYSLSTPGLRLRGHFLRTTYSAGVTFGVRFVFSPCHCLAGLTLPYTSRSRVRSPPLRPARVVVVHD